VPKSQIFFPTLVLTLLGVTLHALEQDGVIRFKLIQKQLLAMKILRYYWLIGIILGSCCWSWRSQSVIAAERVSFWYSALEFSVPVDSLETYAQTGEIDGALATYAQYISPQEVVKLRTTLTYQADIDHVTISRFLNSSLGENVLKYIGDIIKTSPNQNGFYALRSALILAAASPKKLTLLNVLRQFPADTIQVDAQASLKLADTFIELQEQTKKAIATIAKQAVIEGKNESDIDFTEQPNISKLGTFSSQRKTLVIVDQKRDRILDVDFYRPVMNKSASIPVIVISHGLGADKRNFSYLGKHLASYGFAVAILNHPGSDRQNLKSFFAGTTKEVVEAKESINRPRDISYLLDELQRQEQTHPSQLGTLNLDRVGIIGHSLGAYTGLALAGAKPNIEHLQQYCQSDQINFDWFNPSLEFQCLASKLSAIKDYQLSDKRIKAVFAINPISSSIFGQQELNKLKLPVAFVAGSSDLITPPLLEQIEPFSWLGSQDKYLLLINQGTHSYNGSGALGLPNSTTDKSFSPQLARGYFKAMSLAFMKTYLVNSPEYRSFLSSNYARHISQKPMQLDLINSLTEGDLK
jgi:predicted dienelactone hydrolase